MDSKYTKDGCIISFDVLCFSPQVLVFVDDLNMPTLDSYGAQPSMEFIRQFIELQGVFDAKTLTWKVQYNNHGVIRVCVYHFPVMRDANHSYVEQNREAYFLPRLTSDVMNRPSLYTEPCSCGFY